MIPVSYLFVPADRLDRLGKALASNADRVVVDLEDAVPAARKDDARAQLAAATLPLDRVMVRINGLGTPWCDADLDVVTRLGVRELMLPKAEIATAMQALGQRLPSSVSIVALVETALGIWNALSVAQVERVSRLAFGSLDFKVDAGIVGDGPELLYARSRLVLASRVAGLPPPIDGVTTVIGDTGRIEQDALEARRLGFGAKLCIHPSQIDPVHRALQPSDDEFAWADAVLDAAAKAGGAAVQLDGRMVDRPEIERAMRISAWRERRRPDSSPAIQEPR